MDAMNLSYTYRKSNEQILEPLLTRLEEEFGGKRTPYSLRKGALDLITALEVVISFTTAVALKPVISKYFEGLLNGDGMKKLGEKHRNQVMTWLSGVKSDIEKIILVVQPILGSHLITVPTFSEKEEAVALEICLAKVSLYVVLNHAACSPELLLDLPRGVIKAVEFLIEHSIPKDAVALQLYFDKFSRKWKYLLVPTPQMYGRWIDRYIDLDSQQTIVIESKERFIKFFQPDSQDEYKFLVSPFRDNY